MRNLEGGVWSIFTPSAETRIVWLSSTKGDDANDGLSVERPKRTMEAAHALLRAGKPDWLMLMPGTVAPEPPA